MASDTIVFANAPVFVAYAVLETLSTLFYGVIWNFASILSKAPPGSQMCY